MSVLDQIRELEAQKQKLLEDAKKEALAKAHEAISALAELGYNYTLVQGEGSGAVTRAGRRTGIRDQVLAIVQQSKGIAPAAIIKQIGDESKAGKQAVANALSALKKTGAVSAEGGLYR